MSEMNHGKLQALLDMTTMTVDKNASLIELDDMLREEIGGSGSLDKMASDFSEEYMRGYQSGCYEGLAKIAEIVGDYDIQDLQVAAKVVVGELVKDAEGKGWLQGATDKAKELKARFDANAAAGRGLNYAGDAGSVESMLRNFKARAGEAASSTAAGAHQIATRLSRGGADAGAIRRNAVPALAAAGILGAGGAYALRKKDDKKGKDARASYDAPDDNAVNEAFNVLAKAGYTVGE